MNFQNLSKIENADFYLDVAFKRANKVAFEKRRERIPSTRLQKSKAIELAKIDSIKDNLADSLSSIVKAFPSLDSLPEFYKELVKTSMEYGMIKKSLGALMWAKKKIVDIHRETFRKMKSSSSIDDINSHRRMFYGRVSSIVKQVKHDLILLEYARSTMRNFPAIKTNTSTVAIAGFPNVGKSTLLRKLTTAKPEVASYAFTTKGLMLGYGTIAGEKIQYVDTPGTLNRLDTMNAIEQQAYLAMKYLANAIIYVFDITEPFPLSEQKKLLKRIEEMDKPVIIYLSKTDLLEKEQVEDFKKRYKIFVTKEELEKEIKKHIGV